MSKEFSQLDLRQELVQTVAELGYSTPTPIQSAIIPAMVTGQDVIGQAQTGTGKTAAFALPVLHNLVAGQSHVQCLVLTPTRELAMQVASAISEYGRALHVRVLAVYGGQPYYQQVRQLKQGVDIVVGTPGRLLDLIEQKILFLGDVSSVVLDEADEMLSMGFIDDIEAILKVTPASRQTALFSATMPDPIRRLADRYMRNPQAFSVARADVTVPLVEQRYYLVNEADKLAALTRLFEVEPITRALVFTRTRVSTGALVAELVGRSFPAEALNGDMSQDARIRVLDRFRGDQLSVLVATDVAARGLDIDDISHVVNYDLPPDPETYVHRIGRTARAGKAGVAVSLVTPPELWRLRRVEGFTRQKVAHHLLPTVEEIVAQRESALLKQMHIWLTRGRYRREREMALELVEAGYDPVEVAAAALKLARAEEKQRPIAPVSDVQSEKMRTMQAHNPRSHEWRTKKGRSADRQEVKHGHRGAQGNQAHEEGMVRLSLGKGKADGIRVNDVVGTLAHHADIPGYSIGKIRIEEQHTFVDVPAEFVAQVLAKTGQYKIRSQPISVELA